MERRNRRCAVITFNYDLLLDYVFHHLGYLADYCLEEDLPGHRATLLKLHGSLNWFRCGQCRRVIPWRLAEFFRGQEWKPHNESGFAHLLLGSTTANRKLKHCDEEVELEPVIVPPTWSKGEYHSQLTKVWSRAAAELSDAENIFVSGYSLTETDSFFRYLFALGSVGSARIKRFWVFDTDQGGGKVEQRFRTLRGPGIAENRFLYEQRQFSILPKRVKEELQV